VRGAAPEVEYLYPSGGQQGTTVTVTAGNKAGSKLTPWPVKTWTDLPGLEFKAAETNGKFNVTIPKDAPPGPHLVRLYNDDGASSPRMFVIGRHPEVLENEPNDDIHHAQSVKELPAIVNGALEKPGDVDFYAVDVEAGKWLVAELECRRLGSPCDPAMRLLDRDGIEVAFNHDTFGFDPLIAWRAPKAGRYTLQIVGFPYPPGSDIKFVGSKSIIYRLNLTTGPYARFSIPCCAARDRKSMVKLYGWNLGPADASPFNTPLEVEVDPSALPIGEDQMALAPAGMDNVFRLPIDAIAARAESEPNNTPERAQTLTPPAAVSGRIESAGGVHCFAFDAKKKEQFTLTVRANSLNSPVDPMLVIADSKGSEVGREVGAGQDIRLEWTAQTDGRHVVSISDFKRAGGKDYVYQLEIRRSVPDFTAKVDAPTYRLERGKTVKVQVTLAKLGAASKEPLKIEIPNLPEGVTASVPEVPAKGGAVTVTLTATADAKAANQPFQVLVRSLGSGTPIVRVAPFEPAQNTPGLRTSALWLTVGKASSGAVIEKTKK
jgi:hypothetical protein